MSLRPLAGSRAASSLRPRGNAIPEIVRVPPPHVSELTEIGMIPAKYCFQLRHDVDGAISDRLEQPQIRIVGAAGGR
jgi:hypothetical protein